MIILGIDPGLNGALALFDPEHSRLRTLPLPVVRKDAPSNRKARTVRELDLHRLAGWFRTQGQWITFAVLEKVHAHPGQGVSSMFRFGQITGQLEMAVVMGGIPLYYVTPQVWRKETKTPKGKDGSLLQARNLFPQQALEFSRRADEGKAEAALIALAGAKLFLPGHQQQVRYQTKTMNDAQAHQQQQEELDPFA